MTESNQPIHVIIPSPVARAAKVGVVLAGAGLASAGFAVLWDEVITRGRLFKGPDAGPYARLSTAADLAGAARDGKNIWMRSTPWGTVALFGLRAPSGKTRAEIMNALEPLFFETEAK